MAQGNEITLRKYEDFLLGKVALIVSLRAIWLATASGSGPTCLAITISSYSFIFL